MSGKKKPAGKQIALCLLLTAAVDGLGVLLVTLLAVKGIVGEDRVPQALGALVSLCMRLFGNVLGAFVIMELLKLLVPVALPVPFSFYFDIFDGLIQAYVFVFLTSMYIKEAIE